MNLITVQFLFFDLILNI